MNESTPGTETSEQPPVSRWRRFLRFFGIELGRVKFHARLRPRFFAIIGVFLAIFLIGTVATATFSTSPAFCRSCHIMEPYYEAWDHSKHNTVACVDCHYPPGTPRTVLWRKFQAMSQVVKYVTRTYSSKPFAEVEDASCLREGCHATRLLQGRVVSESGVLFDHRPHLERVRYGRKLRCVSCHSQVVVGRHIEVTWDTCYLCHLKGTQNGREIAPIGGCRGCHQLPEKTVKVGNIEYDHKSFLGQHQVGCQSCHQDVIRGSGKVPKDRCYTCHNQPEKIARFKDTAFLHDNHVTQHNTACFHCHEELIHGAAAAGTKDLKYDCGVCHSVAHNPQRDLYVGIGAKGVPPMPSPMYLANVDCVACHLVESGGDAEDKTQTYLGTEKACVDCHDERYRGMNHSVVEMIDGAVTRLESKLTELREARSSRPATPDTVRLGEPLKEAEHNIGFVRRAHGVHNLYYAAEVLRHAVQTMNGVAEELGVEGPKTDDLPLLTGEFCATACHEQVGLKVPAETVTHKGEEMPHLEHVKMDLACTGCHEFKAHKEVTLKKEACEDCH